MAKKLYIKSGTSVYDALLYKTYRKKGTNNSLFREGDLVKSNGILYPITRFDTVPFRGYLSGSTMTFNFGLSDKLYKNGPLTIVGIGSSTMEGYGLSAPNRFWDKVTAWANTQSTSPNMINIGLGGQDTNNLLPTTQGGTVGRNIDTALTYNPNIVILDEPTNWAANYDENAQITKWETIFNYAYNRGVIVIFNGPRPRTPYDTTQKTRLVNLSNLLKVHPYLKYVCNNDFQDYVKSGTTADLRTDWDQGDGIHLNSTGTTHLSDNTTTFIPKVLFPVTAYTSYQIYVSTDGGVNFSLFDTITDVTLNSKSYPSSNGQYKIRGILKDGSTTDFSPVVTITIPTNKTSSFAFCKTAISYGPQWIPVVGDPATTGATVTDSNTGFTVTATAPTNWGALGESNSVNGTGETVDDGGGFFFSPNNTIENNFYNYSNSFDALKWQLEISNLDPAKQYTVKMIASRSSLNANPPYSTAFRVKDNSTTELIETVNSYQNTSKGVTFINKVPDASGKLYIYFNKGTTGQTGHLNALQIIEQ